MSYPNAFLRRGYIGLTAGGTKLGRLIRWGQRTWFEKPSKVNHALGVTRPGWAFPPERLVNFRLAQIMESDWRVREGNLWDLHNKDGIWVFKPLNIPAVELELIAQEVEKKRGKLYGLGQLPLQLIDHKLFFGKPVLRWLLRLSPLDVCSRLWTEAYGKYGYHFGVKDFAATPDDIWDYIHGKGSKNYMKVFEWHPSQSK